MKLMYAKCCGSLVVPSSNPEVHAECKCRTCACWWDNPSKGNFAIWVDNKKENKEDIARVIGIHNGVLTAKFLDSTVVQDLIENADGYIFKDIKSLVANIIPGFTHDTRWAEDEEHNTIIFNFKID